MAYMAMHVQQIDITAIVAGQPDRVRFRRVFLRNPGKDSKTVVRDLSMILTSLITDKELPDDDILL